MDIDKPLKIIDQAIEYMRDADPDNFIIDKVYYRGNYTVVEVTYPDCTNFEGRKILVFEGYLEYQLKTLKTLDPHFEKDGLPLVARIRPDERGLEFLSKLLEEEPEFNPEYEHRKRGTLYEVVAAGLLQTDTPVCDLEKIIIYKDANNLHWVRPEEEFKDGRFERIS